MSARILVAEDEPQIRQYVADILALLEDVDVTFAPSGEVALERLREGDWDLVISDQRMGPTDGVVVLREAERLVPAAQRMMITGYAELALVADAKNGAHVHRFLPKPFPPDALRVAAEELLAVARDERLRRDAFRRAQRALETAPSLVERS